MITRRDFTKGLALAALPGVGSSLVPGFARAQSKSLGSLVLQTGFDAGEVLYVVGSQKGFFKEKGIETSVRQVLTASDATQALILGQIDAVSGTEIPMLGARMNRGDNIRILGTMGTSDKQFAAVASKKVASPAQLLDPGIKVGISPGSGGVYWLEAFAKSHKLDRSKIQTVNVAPNGMVGAFRNGDVDAIFTWQPIVENGLKVVDGAHVLAYGGDNGVFQAQQYIVVNQHVWDKPEILNAFLRVMIDTGKWVEANKKEAIEIVSGFLSTKPETFAAIMSNYNYNVKFTQAQVDQLKAVYAFMKANNLGNGEIKDWTSFIDPKPLAAIDASLVSISSV